MRLAEGNYYTAFSCWVKDVSKEEALAIERAFTGMRDADREKFEGFRVEAVDFNGRWQVYVSCCISRNYYSGIYMNLKEANKKLMTLIRDVTKQSGRELQE